MVFSSVVSAADSLNDTQETQIAKVQVPFIENQGQIDSQVEYYTDTLAGRVYVTQEGLTYALNGNGSLWCVKESFQNSNKVNVIGLRKSLTKVNIFKGNSSQSKLSTYNQVKYTNLYNKIDLNLKAYGNNIEKIYTVKVGGNPKDILMEVNGSQGLKVNAQGELEIQTGTGVLKFTKPFAYQIIGGKKVEIPVSYNLNGSQYSFNIGNYNKKYKLIIDPLLASTPIGGSYSTTDADGFDSANAIAIDASGNVYITGVTSSNNFPTTTGAFDTSFNGKRHDVFVSKFNSDLTQLLASTYIGGTGHASYGGFEDYAEDILVDASGNIYITGYTCSGDFPATSGAYDKIGGTYSNSKTFITKLNNDLSTILASTYLGGSDGFTDPVGIDVDLTGNIYITGITSSSNFPTTGGAYNRNFNGSVDVFVSKFNSSLSQLLASTYLGGTAWDDPSAISLDSSGNVFVTGNTESTDFPTTSGAYDRTYNGGFNDAFISKFNSDLTGLLASTYIGGTERDETNDMVIDNSNNVYITGQTRSNDGNSGTDDIFISKLNNSLNSVLSTVFLGSSDNDSVDAITCDLLGNIYITGHTYRSDFPITSGAYDPTINGTPDSYGSYDADAYITKLNNSLSTLLASTFLGSNSTDYAYDIFVTSSGMIFVTGFTGDSSSFPSTNNLYTTKYEEAFICKFNSLKASDATQPPTVTANPTGGTYTSTKTVTLTTNDPDSTATTYYTTDGSNPKTSSTRIKYTNPLTITTTTTLKFGAVDPDDNWSDITSQNYIIIDKTAPKVSTTTPTNNKTGFSRTGKITIKFSENIYSSTYFSKITIKKITTGKTVTITKSISGKYLYLNTSSKRSSYTWYEVTIPAGAIKDKAGNKLTTAYTFKFKTGG